MTGGAKHEEEGARAPSATNATIFVSDASVEAERIAQSLRTSGYTVVDVPLSMLVARVAVQRPRVILIDADSDGALDAVARMRELPDADGVDVLFFARVGGALASAEDAMAHEGSGFFARPIDAAAVLKKIEALAGGARPPERGARQTTPPPSIPLSSSPSSSAAQASLPPASMRQVDSSSSRPPSARASVPATTAAAAMARVSARPGGMPIEAAVQLGADPLKRALSAPLSPELEQLLAEAEQRVPMQASPESLPPTPEEEIEAVLPAELLESLDEPLDEGEDEDLAHESSYQPSRTGTGSGKMSTSTGSGTGAGSSSGGHTGAASASGSSGGGTGAGTGAGDTGVGSKARRAITGSERRNEITGSERRSEVTGQERRNEAPLTPAPIKTHGGTHSGSSSSGGTTGNVDIEKRGDASASSFGGASDRGAASAPFTGGPQTPGNLRGQSQSQPPPTAYSPAQGDAGVSIESLRRPLDLAAMAPAIPPVVLVPGEAPRVLARAIATRTTGAVAFDSPDGVRRAVFREGDVVTCASGSDEESLLAFLGVRGELPRETVRRLVGKFPAFGRHAGAALVAHGYLRQDQLWPILRAHAEWILGRMMEATVGNAVFEADPPGRLRAEPGVFGGSTGAEVFVEVLRRVEPMPIALERLGGGASRIGDGENASLLGECALGARERELIAQARGRSVQQMLDSAPDTDMATVLHAMSCLGVVEILRAVGRGASGAPRAGDEDAAAGIQALDEDAVRARIRARMQLVDEGDYFAVLGVAKNATGYEVRRAFLELRRELEPSRILTPAVADLADDVRKIVTVIEEAYEILHDAARRERYRRAIDAVPKA